MRQILTGKDHLVWNFQLKIFQYKLFTLKYIYGLYSLGIKHCLDLCLSLVFCLDIQHFSLVTCFMSGEKFTKVNIFFLLILQIVQLPVWFQMETLLYGLYNVVMVAAFLSQVMVFLWNGIHYFHYFLEIQKMKIIYVVLGYLIVKYYIIFFFNFMKHRELILQQKLKL